MNGCQISRLTYYARPASHNAAIPPLLALLSPPTTHYPPLVMPVFAIYPNSSVPVPFNLYSITADVIPHDRVFVYAEGPDTDGQYVERPLPMWPSRGYISPVNTAFRVRDNIPARWTLTPVEDENTLPLFFNSAVHFSSHLQPSIDFPALCALTNPVGITTHHNERYFVIPGWRFEDHQVYYYTSHTTNTPEPILASAEFCLPVRYFEVGGLPLSLRLTRFLPQWLASWVVKMRYQCVFHFPSALCCDEGVAC